VHTVGRELRELVEQFPGLKDTTVEGGSAERLNARKELKNLVLMVRRIGVAAAAGHFDEAAAEYQNYRKLTFAAVPIVLKTAEPWSLFNPAVHKAAFCRTAPAASVGSEAPALTAARWSTRCVL